MKQRKTYLLFAAMAALCVVFQLFRSCLPVTFTTAIAFPFEQLAYMLRIMSLAGSGGNAAAIVIYAVICLLPIAFALFVYRRRGLRPRDALLLLLSAVLFAALYVMINPGVTGAPAQLRGMVIAISGGVIYSVIISYIILCLLSRFLSADGGGLRKYMSCGLYVIGALFIWLAFGSGIGSLGASIKSVTESNTGFEGALFWTYAALTLEYIADALPYVLDVFIIVRCLALTREAGRNRYSNEAVAATEKLSKACVKCLSVDVCVSLFVNILKFAFMRLLVSVSVSIQIPVLSIVFVLAVLLLARYVKENKALKDDNDMFI